jgi:putative Mg2+ transporter-C (MgtC) family protein
MVFVWQLLLSWLIVYFFMLSPLPEIELATRIVLAVILGGLIGLEREAMTKPAGLRTHVLVCVGSTLFTVLSASIVGTGIDETRIAAGIVTGIGFLAAGAIFKEQDRVQGMTTAADIWVVAAVGVALGFGYYLAAILSAVIVFVVLSIGKIFRQQAEKK